MRKLVAKNIRKLVPEFEPEMSAVSCPKKSGEHYIKIRGRHQIFNTDKYIRRWKKDFWNKLPEADKRARRRLLVGMNKKPS